MKRVGFAMIAFTAALIYAPFAKADTFDFSINGGVPVTGEINATLISSGVYEVTSGWALVGNAYDLSLDPNPGSSYDNLLYYNTVGDPLVDSKGISFNYASDSWDYVNISYEAATGYSADIVIGSGQWENGPGATFEVEDVTPAATPEPSSWLLLASGVVGLFAWEGLRRRRELTCEL